MEGLDVINLIAEKGLAFGISVAFIAAIFCLIKIGLQYLKDKVVGSSSSSKKITDKQETEVDVKIQLITSKALINSHAARVNFMRFFYDEPKDGTPQSITFMCCYAEEVGKGIASLTCSLRHIAVSFAYPVFIAALQRRGQILLKGTSHDPNYVESVYDFHDVGSDQVYCATAYDIRMRPVGYVFAKKSNWDNEGEREAIKDAAAFIGVALSSLGGF
ncbi:hypothetical protein FACS1894127_5750 [Clostridia bacterium]|nr:hypothetical protein FACS1894127_5750 [Clostridia bacterium]